MTEINKTNSSEITTGPQPKDLADLELWVDSQLDVDPETQELRKKLTEARTHRNTAKEQEIVGSIRAIKSQLLAEGSKKFGIRLEADDTKDRAERKEILKKAIGNPDLSEQEVLTQLGMIDEEGKFTFPDKMFSQNTNTLWRRYIDWVRSQSKYFDMMRNGEAIPITRSELEAIEISRTKNHDELTRAVMTDLGVEDNEANFTYFRRLLAKMRDNAIPNMGEIKGTASKAYEWYEKLSKDKAA